MSSLFKKKWGGSFEMEMFNVSGYENAESYMIQGAGINSIVTNPFQQVKAMCDDGTPEAFVDQGMYYPAADSYGYYCTGFESPGEWKDHMIFGVDGSEIQYAGAQTESLPYVYYTPTYGYAQSSYNPYNPFIPGATPGFNVPYTGLQQQYPFPTFQDPASSPGCFPIAQPDIFPNSSVDPLLGTGVAFATRSDGKASEDGFNSSYEVYNQSFPKPTMRQTSSLTQISGGIRAHVGSSQQSLTYEGVPSGGNVNKASSYGHQTGFASSPLHAVDNFSNENALPHRKQSNVALASNNGLPGFESSATSRTSLDRGFRSMFNVGRNLNDINRNLDMLGEQNRGPRTNKVRHQLAVKAHMTKMGGSNGQEKIVSRNDEYNKDDFSVEYVNAKFFVIKSYSEDDVHKSIKYSVWSSTHHGNKKLQSAYEDAQEISAGKARGCPIFLFFSVNASGQFCGVAEMIGPLDFHKDMDFWQQDKWSGSFNVKWHIIKDVPNSSFRHILLKNNENKPVTNSRDTQEIRSNEGVEMLKIFKEYPLKTSVLDDFIFYESREQIMQEEKARLVSKSFQNPVFVPLPAFSPIEKKDPLVGLQQPNDEKAKEQKDPKVETSTTMQQLSLNTLVSQSSFGGKNAERSTVKTETDTASALKISSLDINQKDDASESSADAAPSLASTVPVDIVTVGSMPVKVNGFAEASGFLTVGTIPLDSRALQLDQEGATPAKRGS